MWRTNLEIFSEYDPRQRMPDNKTSAVAIEDERSPTIAFFEVEQGNHQAFVIEAIESEVHDVDFFRRKVQHVRQGRADVLVN